MPSIGAGALLFLQYDEFLGTAALVVWATILYLDSHGQAMTLTRFLAFAVVNTFLSNVFGPSGCALLLLWARDELILGRDDTETKKLQ
jgi:hypothetical protein